MCREARRAHEAWEDRQLARRRAAADAEQAAARRHAAEEAEQAAADRRAAEDAERAAARRARALIDAERGACGRCDAEGMTAVAVTIKGQNEKVSHHTVTMLCMHDDVRNRRAAAIRVESRSVAALRERFGDQAS
jgi:hypothetical protein